MREEIMEALQRKTQDGAIGSVSRLAATVSLVLELNSLGSVIVKTLLDECNAIAVAI
jgi:hypothetical protein